MPAMQWGYNYSWPRRCENYNNKKRIHFDLVSFFNVCNFCEKSSDWPEVTIGVFVEKPTPFLEEFLIRLVQLYYPKSKLSVYVHNSVRFVLYSNQLFMSSYSYLKYPLSRSLITKMWCKHLWMTCVLAAFTTRWSCCRRMRVHWASSRPNKKSCRHPS